MDYPICINHLFSRRNYKVLSFHRDRASSLFSAGMLIVAICNGLSRILRWSECSRIPRVLPYFIITGIGLFGLTDTALLVDVDVNKSFFEMSAFV